MKDNLIRNKALEFAKSIFKLRKVLLQKKEYVVLKQLLRSGTSIGANIEEAIVAQSRKDFLHKLSIALKEAHETRYWLLLLSHEHGNVDYKTYQNDIEEIIRILNSIVKTLRVDENSHIIKPNC